MGLGHWELWGAVGWLVVILVPLWFMKRWIGQHLQGLGLLLTGSPDLAVLLYFLILLPGIVVHELSHWLTARLLGVPAGGITIWPRTRRGRLSLGSVRVARVDPLRNSLIGVAPLVAGSLFIVFIGERILGTGQLGEAVLWGRWSLLGERLWALRQVPDFWLWLYLIFALSNAMLPSASDREPWRPVLIFLGAVGATMLLMGGVPQVPPALSDLFLRAVGYLAYAFTLTVAVDAVFMALIWAMETAVGWLTGRRVEY